MPEYIYQIKGKDEYGRWQWPPIYADKITAADKKEARRIVEEEYGTKMPGVKLKNEDHAFLCTIDELKEKDHRHEWFEIKKCQACDKPFRIIDNYRFNNNGGSTHCSHNCRSESYMIKRYQAEAEETASSHAPVIYKITNRVTGLCYIGKTTQAFTLRWYQHFYQSKKGTKFYEAVHAYPVTDWIFEVIEIISIPDDIKQLKKAEDYIFEREMHYIRIYNSIDNGYNSVSSQGAHTAVDLSQIPLYEKENNNT